MKLSVTGSPLTSRWCSPPQTLATPPQAQLSAGWFILILQGPLQVHNQKVNQLEANADDLQRGLTLNAKHPQKLWKCETSVRPVKLWARLTCCSVTTPHVFSVQTTRSIGGLQQVKMDRTQLQNEHDPFSSRTNSLPSNRSGKQWRQPG